MVHYVWISNHIYNASSKVMTCDWRCHNVYIFHIIWAYSLICWSEHVIWNAEGMQALRLWDMYRHVSSLFAPDSLKCMEEHFQIVRKSARQEQRVIEGLDPERVCIYDPDLDRIMMSIIIRVASWCDQNQDDVSYLKDQRTDQYRHLYAW